LSLKSNYQKFKLHLGNGGLFYAFWQGIKYFIFLIRKQRLKFEQTSENMITKESIKITFSDRAIKVFWDDVELTKGAGLNVAINTLGIWTNSTKADWQILEKEKDKFTLKIILKELPLSQIWSMQIKDERKISWQIDMVIEESLYVDEFRIACLLNSRYKTWVSSYQEGDFPRLDNCWRDLYLNKRPVSLVGARFPIEGEFLPSFILELQDKDLLPLIQNSLRHIDSHIIGFKVIDLKEKMAYSPGYYHLFSGGINLFEKDYLLDSKIESLRQASLETVVVERAKKYDEQKAKDIVS